MTQEQKDIIDRILLHVVLTDRKRVRELINELLSTPAPQSGEWQLCPKCQGTGRAMNWDNQIPMRTDTCDVCEGKKIIQRPEAAPQSGLRWVKASERLPEKSGNYYVKHYGEKFLATFDKGIGFGSAMNNCEWLDEAAPQSDAVEARIFKCKACSNEKFGVKTRIAVPHTCGKN